MDTSITPDVALPFLGQRYRTSRVLKSARGVTTYRALDEQTGHDVIVKATRRAEVPEGTELLLSHEASVLQTIRTPHVAGLVDVATDGDLLFLVMPLVEGVTLETRLASGPLPVLDAVALAEGLAAALGEVFGHGVLHRDVKPANVIVNENGPLDQVALIDFGFSRSERLEGPLHSLPLGTARYASPEQAGSLDRDVDERSDLYSLGAVLFEALSGRPPFVGPSVGDVLRAHLTAPVPSLRDLGIGVPRALDQLVARLLAKEPKDRYQTASAVRIDLEQIRAGLERGFDEPQVVIGAHDRRCCVLGEAVFVGREDELAALGAVLDAVEDGESTLVRLEADSGGGKTRLIEEFRHRCAERGAWTLRGQGIDQAAQRPFQSLRGVAAEIIARAADPAVAAHLRQRVGSERAAACAALPELVPVLEPEEHVELGPEDHGAARSVSALSRLLDALGSDDAPAVVILDDCQWADPLTIRLLRHWGASRAERTGRVMLVAAHRSEEVPPGHPLREVDTQVHLVLPPLGDREVRNLVESMAGRLDDDVSSTVVDLAEGSPFMASAALHGLVESGALVCSHPGWVADVDRLADATASRQAATFLSRRLDLLPADALAFLSAGAVLGKEFDVHVAAHLTDQPAVAAVHARDEARRRHLVWSRGPGTRVAFVHDKVREAMLARLDGDHRRALHARAAEWLVETGSRRSFELAYHFDAAGRPDRALPHALAAAEQARSQHALEIAESQYRIARRAGGDAAAHVRHTVARGLGDVTMLLGRYDEARGFYEEALGLADGAAARSEVEVRLGELAFKSGDLDESAAAAERGLRLLGRRVPRTNVGFLVWALWEVAVQAMHSLVPRLLVGRRATSHRRAPDDLLAARHYSRLGHVYWFARGPVPTLWAHLREMNVAERYGPTRELAQAYSEHAPAMSLVPWWGRGIRYVERSLDIRRQLGDVWGQGQSHNFHGILLYAAGRFDEAVECFQEAIRLLERAGDRWELNIARVHVALAWYRRGRLAEAIEVARRVHDDGVEIGDAQAAGVAVEVGSKASLGQIPADVVAAEFERETRDSQLRVEVLQAETVRRLALHDTEGAVETADTMVGLVREHGLRNEYVASAYTWAATAVRRHLESGSMYSASRPLQRQLRRAVRRACFHARFFQNNRAHALREAGLAAALRGRHRAARRLLRRSVAVAGARGQAHERARSLVDYGRVGRVHGWADAGERSDEGRVALDEMESAVDGALTGVSSRELTLSLLDRFDTLLDEGRRVAGELTRRSVLDAVRDAAIQLLRAEQCVVVDLHEIGDPAVGDSDDSRSLSSSLIGQAVAAGRPVLASPHGADDSSDELILAGVRSAICAPILERGEVTACFYATHGQISSLFGDDEIRISEFITALAGAALENARGFADVEALQRSLEQRVDERTQQLTTTLQELERLNTELREANKAKSVFVSMVSHELRTPITPIVGLSSTLLERWKDMPEDLREECLNAVHRQGIRLARLVDDLLELSRIETGTLSADPRVVRVRDVVDVTLEHLTGSLTDVAVECPDDLVAVADPDRLQQILVNYLENARKYGSAPVAIRASGAGRWMEIAVVDHGPGVPEEFRAELFEKFTRAEELRTVDGTGLGLSIVKGLAEAQGGEAWYEPNEPTGSRFCVKLPRTSLAAAARVLSERSVTRLS